MGQPSILRGSALFMKVQFKFNGRSILWITLALLCPSTEGWADRLSDWRLESRFGYAPKEGHDGMTREVKPLALDRLQAAWAASHVDPLIPEPLSILNTSLPEAFERWRDQRKAQQSQQAEPNATTREFTRNMSRAAMAWRVYQCSQPQGDNPLLAKMTEFWFNHLNVYTFKGSVQPFIGDYLVHAIRPNALGNFEDLLLASFKHPAMLYYLDQWLNVTVDRANSPNLPNRFKSGVKGVNENYAREVLELHTMGVNSGYTQSDVQSLAKILTGWTVSPNNASGSQFVSRLHDKTDKTLLGQTFTNQGADEAVAALKLLAAQPQTAHRVSLRLAQWFVSDHPSEQLVGAMAKTYLQSHGNILQVMTTLIESDETWDPKSELLKTPVDFVCSTLTLAGGAKDLKDYSAAIAFLANSGQPMNAWQTPDGYSTLADQWMSAEALSRRADFAFSIGPRVQNPATVLSWVSEPARRIIEKEKPSLQASFSLASPDFMHK